MGRRGWAVGMLGAMLLGRCGCNTMEGFPVHWPWTKQSMLAEKYEVPPPEDARYSNPPTYPKETMTPQLKVKETPGLDRATPGTGFNVGGRPSGPGGY